MKAKINAEERLANPQTFFLL
ncbi:MAG: ABC transporter, ATP-binding/permease protein [Lactobacillus helveticus]|uniref:Uncharacterized protein n=2 Tax=Lactobacillus helveticus TaxID=1587 RepID=U4QFY3_LACHE|nr:Protein of unknown function [Lactobacillus helveticus CIRM-BIA 953]